MRSRKVSRMLKVHKRAGAWAFALALAGSLSIPGLAFASVTVDETELAQGDNAVGGGTATLADTTLNMVNVIANTIKADTDLTINFNGGNEIEMAIAEGNANVEMNFSGENEIEEVYATENSNVTLNANENNGFEEVNAYDDAHVTINVTGETDIESIDALDYGSITIRGTECQKKDTVNLGEDENTAFLTTTNGTLVIDHVTINLKAEEMAVGSVNGDMVMDTSKIASDDDNKYTLIQTGGTMLIKESVIDMVGTVYAVGQMTINHSDVKVKKPEKMAYGEWDKYRVYSSTGIELIDEKNGKVKEGNIYENKVYYLDTDGGDDVDLEADGKPAYYKCKDDDDDDEEEKVVSLPKTGDKNAPLLPLSIALMSAATMGIAASRRRGDSQSR